MQIRNQSEEKLSNRLSSISASISDTVKLPQHICLLIPEFSIIGTVQIKDEKKNKIWEIPYIETSAKTGQNLEEAFIQLTTEIKSR